MSHTGFTVRQLDYRTWAINDHNQDMLYLLAGEQCALLIDTGWGVGNLPSLVSRLTDLPIIVVNTHGHPDHALGNGDFSQVYLHPLDEGMYLSYQQPRVQDWLHAHMLGNALPAYPRAQWQPRLPTYIVPVGEGDLFDLGHRAVEVIDTPGHTRGSICLLDYGNRWLFSGDSLLSGRIWMHLNESTSLRTYAHSLSRLERMSHQFDAVLSAHAGLAQLPEGKYLLDEQVQGVGAVLDGRLAGAPEHTIIGDGAALDFGHTGLIYRPDRIETAATGV